MTEKIEEIDAFRPVRQFLEELKKEMKKGKTE